MNISQNQKKVEEKLQAVSPENRFVWDEKIPLLKYAKGKLSRPSAEDPESIAKEFLEETKDLMNLEDNQNQQLNLISAKKDKWGYSHVFFQQIINDIPVYQGGTQIHIDKEGVVTQYKDYRISHLPISLDSKIDKNSAMEISYSALKDDKESLKHESAQLCLYRDDNKDVHLAWETKFIQAVTSEDITVFVDAHDGTVLYKVREIQHIQREIYDAKNSEDYERGQKILEENQAEMPNDQVAVKNFQNLKFCHDYFEQEHEWASFDGNGMTIKSTIHYGQNVRNAFWCPYYEQLFFGDSRGGGNPTGSAIDVVGHEFAHGLQHYTANFRYVGESGALSESTADFFGLIISNENEIINWLMGEDTFLNQADAFRDVSDPHKFDHPDHMSEFIFPKPGEEPNDNNDNFFVHYNSGIINKFFFLLIKGGAHHGISVKGIGKSPSEDIVFLAMTQYLFSPTRTDWTFNRFREAITDACVQIHGENSEELDSVKSAFAAIGLPLPEDQFFTSRKISEPNLPIPDNDPNGIQNTIKVSESGILRDIAVTIVINHTYKGDLKVNLESPTRKRISLFERKPSEKGGINSRYSTRYFPKLRELLESEIKGDWKLLVSDNEGKDVGQLKFWEIFITAQKSALSSIKKESSPSIPIPDNNSSGIEDSIQVNESGVLVDISVSVNIAHTWIGDLRVLLVTPSGSEIILHNFEGHSRDNIKKTFSTSNSKSLEDLVGSNINGEWKMKVKDSVTQDVGTLNSWSLEIFYQ